jgi:capsid protein
LAEECSAQGRDWEEVAEQRAREIAKITSLGMNPDPTQGPTPEPVVDPQEDTANVG